MIGRYADWLLLFSLGMNNDCVFSYSLIWLFRIGFNRFFAFGITWDCWGWRHVIINLSKCLIYGAIRVSSLKYTLKQTFALSLLRLVCFTGPLESLALFLVRKSEHKLSLDRILINRVSSTHDTFLSFFKRSHLFVGLFFYDCVRVKGWKLLVCVGLLERVV